MKAKNTTKELLNGNTVVGIPTSNGFNTKLHPNKNAIVGNAGKPPLTPESLIMDKLSPGPSSSPFLRPSSATSSSNSFYQESSASNLNKSLEDSPFNQYDDEDRLVIAEPPAPGPVGVVEVNRGQAGGVHVNNNNDEEAADDDANVKPADPRFFGMGDGHDIPKSA